MAVTPNIGLVKQDGNEYGDYEITNDNWDTIDEEIGKRGKTVNGIVPDDTGDYKVHEVTFARQIITDDAQQSTGEFLFRTTGGDASLSDGDAKLIAIFGRMEHTGIVEESLEMTVNAAERDPEEESITAQIDRDTFVAYVADSGTITLTYTDAWSANPTLYGVTVEGTPVSGDQIVIVYVKEDRGLITPSAPNKFISTGWNLYNNALGYARVKKYSSSYGFIIGGTYTKVEFATTPTGTRTTITPASGYFTIPSDGYVIVTGGNATNTYILMTWSDWSEGYEGDWKAYTESVIDLSSIMSNFTNGLLQVAGIADEINFGTGNAYSRIERIAYTAQNIADVIASGRPYDADENYIYVVRSSEVAYSFSVSGDYTACDHGQEIIEGGTVPVYVQCLYGQNLVDKLRTDVVTKSQDLVNNLTSDATNKALTAAQGKALKAITDTLNSNFGVVHPATELSSVSDITSLLNQSLNGRYITFIASQTLYETLTGISKRAVVTAFKSTSGSNYIEFISVDHDGDARSGFYNINSNDKNIYISSIHKDSVTGTTSSGGNISKTMGNKVRILSAWSSTGGYVVLPYPQAGADDDGQYTWWFHILNDDSSSSVAANQNVTVYFTYIRT